MKIRLINLRTKLKKLLIQQKKKMKKIYQKKQKNFMKQLIIRKKVLNRKFIK